MADPGDRLPLVAIVGRPNVGKSSLVNRIIGRREAIVEATPGVTRDRQGFITEWGGRRFEIVDTGGLEPGAQGLDARVAEQAHLAMEAADVVVLVVDAATGPIQDDHEVATVLRRSNKPVIVAANKVDDPRDEPTAASFFKLGLGEPVPLSALHGRGSGDFLEILVSHLPDEIEPGVDDAWASVAIVGRPNVGKSSTLNALLGEERSIVDAVPGTTRDPVDSYMRLDGDRRLKIIDTAGMRRQTQIKDPLEYFSYLRSRRTLQRADAVLLVVDVSEGVTGHDQRLAQEIVESGRACSVALNKWDVLKGEESDRLRIERTTLEKLRFVPWAPIVRTSALTKRGIQRILPTIEIAVASHRRRLPTAAVNRIVHEAQERRPHPRVGGRSSRIYYAVQARVEPPTFLLFTSGRLEASYVRYLENRIRESEGFAGSPVDLQVRVKTRRQLET